MSPVPPGGSRCGAVGAQSPGWEPGCCRQPPDRHVPSPRRPPWRKRRLSPCPTSSTCSPTSAGPRRPAMPQVRSSARGTDTSGPGTGAPRGTSPAAPSPRGHPARLAVANPRGIPAPSSRESGGIPPRVPAEPPSHPLPSPCSPVAAPRPSARPAACGTPARARSPRASPRCQPGDRETLMFD